MYNVKLDNKIITKHMAKTTVYGYNNGTCSYMSDRQNTISYLQ